LLTTSSNESALSLKNCEEFDRLLPERANIASGKL
jgi:hypothetical protein